MTGIFGFLGTITEGQIKRRVEYLNNRQAKKRQEIEVINIQNACNHDDFRIYGNEQIGQVTCKHCRAIIDFCDAVNKKMESVDEKTNKLTAIIDIYEQKLANLPPTIGHEK
jgi:hypothetical protein